MAVVAAGVVAVAVGYCTGRAVDIEFNSGYMALAVGVVTGAVAIALVIAVGAALLIGEA
jgi:hypothetical protein